MAAPDPAVPPRPGRAFLAYNVLRLVLLAACLGIGYLVGLHGLLLIVAALLVSGVLSFFLLKRQRIGVGVAVEQQVTRGRRRMDTWTASEDDFDDTLDDEARARLPMRKQQRR